MDPMDVEGRREVLEALNQAPQDLRVVAEKIAFQTIDAVVHENEMNRNSPFVETYRRVVFQNDETPLATFNIPHDITNGLVFDVLKAFENGLDIPAKTLIQMLADDTGISSLQMREVKKRLVVNTSTAQTIIETLRKIAKGEYLEPRASVDYSAQERPYESTDLVLVPSSPSVEFGSLSRSGIDDWLSGMTHAQVVPSYEKGTPSTRNKIVELKPQNMPITRCLMCNSLIGCRCLELTTNVDKPTSIQLAYKLAVAAYDPDKLDRGEQAFLMADLTNENFRAIMDGYIAHPRSKPFFDEVLGNLWYLEDPKGPVFNEELPDSFFRDRIEYLRMQMNILTTAELATVDICAHRPFLFGQTCNFRSTSLYYQQAYKRMSMNFPEFVNHHNLDSIDYDFWVSLVVQVHHINRVVDVHHWKQLIHSESAIPFIQLASRILSIPYQTDNQEPPVALVEKVFAPNILSLWCKTKAVSFLSLFYGFVRMGTETTPEAWLDSGRTLLQLATLTMMVNHISAHDFLGEQIAKDPIIGLLQLGKQLSGCDRDIAAALGSNIPHLRWLGHALANPPHIHNTHWGPMASSDLAEIAIFLEAAGRNPGGVKAAFLAEVGDFHKHRTMKNWVKLAIWLKGVSTILDIGQPSFQLSKSVVTFERLRSEVPDDRILQTWVQYGEPIIQAYINFFHQNEIPHFDLHHFDKFTVAYAQELSFSLVDCKRVVDLFSCLAFEPDVVEDASLIESSTQRAISQIYQTTTDVYSVSCERNLHESTYESHSAIIVDSMYMLALIKHRRLHVRDEAPASEPLAIVEQTARENLTKSLNMVYHINNGERRKAAHHPSHSTISYEKSILQAAAIDRLDEPPTLTQPQSKPRPRQRTKKRRGAAMRATFEPALQAIYGLTWEARSTNTYDPVFWDRQRYLFYGVLGLSYYEQENAKAETLNEDWYTYFLPSGMFASDDLIRFIVPEQAYDDIETTNTWKLTQIAIEYTFIRHLATMSDGSEEVVFTSLLHPDYTIDEKTIRKYGLVPEDEMIKLLDDPHPLVLLAKPLPYL